MDIETGSGMVRVEQKEYKDKQYIDIRKYYKDETTDEWKPTRKGIMFNLELKDQIVEALAQL